MPNHLMVVLLEGPNASFPKGCVGGAVAWYFFSFFVRVLSDVDWASTTDIKSKMADNNNSVRFAFMFLFFRWGNIQFTSRFELAKFLILLLLVLIQIPVLLTIISVQGCKWKTN